MTGLLAGIGLNRGAFELDVAVRVAAGEVVAVLGPNGAGKSTLLRVLAGLEPGATGSIDLDGDAYLGPAARRPVPPASRSIGVVFQDYLLFPHLDARDNVAFGLRSRGVPRSDARREAEEWLERLGLGGLGTRRPADLSGGQAQRVALARALAPRPRLLLLDEPLAALDVATRHEVRRDLRRYLADFAGATVMVTHDPLDAFAVADRAVILEHGRVTQEGTLRDLAARPRSGYAADLLGVNLYRGRASDGSVALEEGSTLAVAGAPDGPVFVVVRPNAVAIHRTPPSGSARNVWPVKVEATELLADRVLLRLSGRPGIVAEVTPAAVDELRLSPEDDLWVSVKATEIDAYPA